jgi:hypothetical protein
VFSYHLHIFIPPVAYNLSININTGQQVDNNDIRHKRLVEYTGEATSIFYICISSFSLPHSHREHFCKKGQQFFLSLV